ncbi:DUF6221 family protein [Streptomyces antibioticus]|uniref:DUF6221 family protein n=1 Tax=Streptomyces antibioticus TaxID=1890 RepID=UPI003711200E
MRDLVVWLGVQLDKDERIARAAADESEERWSPGDRILSDSVNGAECGTPVVIGSYEYLDWTIREHIAEWDPARVLQEIDAKRQRIALHSGPHECASYDFVSREINPCQWVAADEACTTLRLEALPYADRPGFREEWRP